MNRRRRVTTERLLDGTTAEIVDRPGTNFTDKGCVSTEFYTPESVNERVRVYFGGPVELDPATAPHNPTRARRFFTVAEDGLKQVWAPARVFVNPPYGTAIRAWVAKIGEEAAKGAEIVGLLPGQRFEQRYWQTNLFRPELTTLVFVTGRLEFTNPAGKPLGGNPYGSMLWVFNGSWERAVAAFSPIGMVLQPGRVVHHEPSAPLFDAKEAKSA